MIYFSIVISESYNFNVNYQFRVRIQRSQKSDLLSTHSPNVLIKLT